MHLLHLTLALGQIVWREHAEGDLLGTPVVHSSHYFSIEDYHTHVVEGRVHYNGLLS